MATTTNGSVRLTFEGNNVSPVWSIDGRSVYFLSERTGTNGLDGFKKAADNSSDAEQLWTAEGESALTSISPDGRWLIVVEDGGPGGRDLARFSLQADSGGIPTEYLRTGDNEADGAVSPDGQWLAYWLRSPEADGLFVRSFPDATGLQRVSDVGVVGVDPVWAPDGGALYFSRWEHADPVPCGGHDRQLVLR